MHAKNGTRTAGGREPGGACRPTRIHLSYLRWIIVFIDRAAGPTLEHLDDESRRNIVDRAPSAGAKRRCGWPLSRKPPIPGPIESKPRALRKERVLPNGENQRVGAEAVAGTATKNNACCVAEKK